MLNRNKKEIKKINFILISLKVLITKELKIKFKFIIELFFNSTEIK
jgi:hypothetical protein